MSDILFRINRLGHGAQQLIVDDRFQLGAAHTLQNIRKILGLWIFQQPVRADVQVFQQLVQQIDLDGLWTVMDAVDKRQLLLNREGRSRLICGEHEFLDHPLAFPGRTGHNVLDLSVLDDKFGLVGADVHCPAVKAPLAQNLCQLLHQLDLWKQLVIFFQNLRRGAAVQDSVDLRVDTLDPRADIALDKAEALDLAAQLQGNQRREGQANLVRIEGADAVGQLLGQHRDDLIGVIDTGAAAVSFQIQRCARTDIVTDISDVDAKIPVLVVALQGNRIVQILAVG